jgi:hypothetical protein
LKLDHDMHSEIGPESIKNARGRLRCPACFMIRDAMPKEFTCGLTLCPRMFRNIEPPTNGAAAYGRVAPLGIES